MEEINRLAQVKQLSSLEKPGDVIIGSVAFSADNSCLTPSMKLKRHEAAKLYKNEIDALCATLD